MTASAETLRQQVIDIKWSCKTKQLEPWQREGGSRDSYTTTHMEGLWEERSEKTFEDFLVY
jgi:hypothetical protein